MISPNQHFTSFVYHQGSNIDLTPFFDRLDPIFQTPFFIRLLDIPVHSNLGLVKERAYLPEFQDNEVRGHAHAQTFLYFEAFQLLYIPFQPLGTILGIVPI